MFDKGTDTSKGFVAIVTITKVALGYVEATEIYLISSDSKGTKTEIVERL